MSLVGGRRVVLVRQAVDGLSKALEALLAMGGHEALVIVEAGELGTASPLRRLAERAKPAAAIACYRADGRALDVQLRELLREQGLAIEPEAMAFLAAHVGANLDLTRNEIAKLALYKGVGLPGAVDGGRVTLADLEASVGNSSVLGIDRLVWAGLVGRPGDAARALDRLLGEGQAPVRLVRAFATMFLRLLPLRGRVEAGEEAVAVIEAIKPPVHFSQKPSMRRALESWASERLASGIEAALATELACKRAQSPDRLLLHRFLLELHEIRRAGA